MANLDVVSRGHDFSALHAAMQRYVDQDILAGLNCAVLHNRDTGLLRGHIDQNLLVNHIQPA